MPAPALRPRWPARPRPSCQRAEELHERLRAELLRVLVAAVSEPVTQHPGPRPADSRLLRVERQDHEHVVQLERVARLFFGNEHLVGFLAPTYADEVHVAVAGDDAR